MNDEKKIPSPTIAQVKYWLTIWKKQTIYVNQESAINYLFNTLCKDNSNLRDVMLKCSVLNDFYSTNIYKIYYIANHIRDLKIDNDLKQGNLEIVDKIASVKNPKASKKRRFYSFASKYCSHHNSNYFPIYDYYVDRMLRYFRKKDKFCKFKNDDLKKYKNFCKIIYEFKKYYKLDKFNLKELDRYLWQLGKKYFKKSKI